MRITMKIERTSASDPSFSVPTEIDLEEEFEIDSAKVLMDHGDSQQIMEEPPVRFEIKDLQADIETKYHFLEWANCYWNDEQRQGGRLRKVTLNFYDDNDECYRSFMIENAFLSKYEEQGGKKAEANKDETQKYYKAIIRSNAKKQAIDFLPRVKDKE